MQLHNSDRDPDPDVWYLIPAQPENVATAEASFRRWNLVITTILGMIIVGLFMLAIIPKSNNGSAAQHAPAVIHKKLAPANKTATKVSEHLPI